VTRFERPDLPFADCPVLFAWGDMIDVVVGGAWIDCSSAQTVLSVHDEKRRSLNGRLLRIRLMQVRIYRPSKTAMQSGRAKTESWVLEPETTSRRTPEPLMGWVASADTLSQVRLKFETKEEAISYAKRQGWQFTVLPERTRAPRPQAYADNFKYSRMGNWTH